MKTNRTFAEELEDAVSRLGNNYQQEADRVHRDAVRDEKHPFQRVEMRKPDPWKREISPYPPRSDLTL